MSTNMLKKDTYKLKRWFIIIHPMRLKEWALCMFIVAMKQNTKAININLLLYL
jgi:ribosomal protein S3AE